MQGFVTCTTFTTWHHGFRWDSTNPALDLLDHAPEATKAPASAAKRAKPKGASPPKDAAAAAKDGDDADADAAAAAADAAAAAAAEAAASAAAAAAAAAAEPRIDDAEGSLSMELQALPLSTPQCPLSAPH